MNKFFQTLTLAVAFICTATFAQAQTTAMDFNRADCSGNTHHLFADLDAGNVVILEFFMQNCGSCITAGGQLETMKSNLLAQFPGKIKSYATGYKNSYTCASNASWVASHGFTSVPMDSGAAQVAYYGGFGMPTIVILGGIDTHNLLSVPYIGFSNSDITTMTSDITAFLNTTAVEPFATVASELAVFPNPASNVLNISLSLKQATDLSIELVNPAGQTVGTSLFSTENAGAVSKNIPLTNLVSGLYVVKITANGESAFRKVSVVK